MKELTNLLVVVLMGAGVWLAGCGNGSTKSGTSEATGGSGGSSAGGAGGSVADSGQTAGSPDANSPFSTVAPTCVPACIGDTPICDPGTLTCKTCTTTMGCSGATPFCNTASSLSGSVDGGTTGGDAGTMASNGFDAQADGVQSPAAAATGVCVACLVDGDCSAATPICDANRCRFSVAGTWNGFLNGTTPAQLEATDSAIISFNSQVTLNYAGNSCSGPLVLGNEPAPITNGGAVFSVFAENANNGWDLTVHFDSPTTASGTGPRISNGGLICNSPLIFTIGTDSTVAGPFVLTLTRTGD